MKYLGLRKGLEGKVKVKDNLAKISICIIIVCLIISVYVLSSRGGTVIVKDVFH